MTPIISYLQKNQKKLLISFSMLAVLGLGILIWNYQQEQQDAVAQSEMFQAVYQFEAGEYDKALQGDGVYAGFLDIIQRFRCTKAANLAHFYVGICYMHQANYENAIQHLKHFKSRDFLLQARAWSLIGDALVEQKSYAEAVKYYLKAASYKPNEFLSPTYLVKAAITYETQNAYQDALECYQKILKMYAKSPLYAEANKQVSRLEALL